MELMIYYFLLIASFLGANYGAFLEKDSVIVMNLIIFICVGGSYLAMKEAG